MIPPVQNTHHWLLFVLNITSFCDFFFKTVTSTDELLPLMPFRVQHFQPFKMNVTTLLFKCFVLTYVLNPRVFFFSLSLNSLIFPHLSPCSRALRELSHTLLVYIIHGTGKALQNINKIVCQNCRSFFVKRLVETVLRKYLCMCNKCLTGLASFLFRKRSVCF